MFSLQVDSHETLANGVVVQVSGELSNNGEPMRRFMQTFVLAPQSPKKYYVHNDIFRYQDEVFDEPTGDTSTGPGATEDQIREMKETAAVTVQEAAAKATAPIPPVEVMKEPAVPQHTNGANTFGGDPMPVSGAGEPMHVEEPAEWKEQVMTSPPAAAFQSAPAEQWKPSDAVEDSGVGEEVVDAVEADQEAAAPASEPGPRTWSSMVKSGAGAGPGKPPAGPPSVGGGGREAGAKEGTPFSGTSQPAGAGAGKGAGGQTQGGYRGQRGSSQGRSPGQQPQAGQRPERFSKEETDVAKNEKG